MIYVSGCWTARTLAGVFTSSGMAFKPDFRIARPSDGSAVTTAKGMARR